MAHLVEARIFGCEGPSECANCKVGAKCCTWQTEPPDLTRFDIEIIVHHIRSERPDLDEDFFEEPRAYSETAVKRMRLRRDGTCVFLNENGKCEIYALRPIDCQLFPLDIYWERGTYYWALYNYFCDRSSQLDEIYSEMRRAEEMLLPHFEESELWAYAQHRSRLFKSGRWTKLRPVDLLVRQPAENVAPYGKTVAKGGR